MTTIVAPGVIALQLPGCSDAVAPDSAAISVHVKVSGEFPSDRFEIEVDGQSMTFPAASGSLVVRQLSAGLHTLSLVGLPPGCLVDGSARVTVATEAATLSNLEFAVTCASPGTLAFVSTRDGAPHIYLSSPSGKDIRRLTNQLPSEFVPAWSPDGKRLAFNSDDGTYVINRDGSGLRRLRDRGLTPSWSPDGKRILVTDTTRFKIIPVDDADAPVIELGIEEAAVAGYGIYEVEGGTWSPDGARIAFSAWTSFDFEQLFVMNVDGSGARTLVTAGQIIWNECGPRWAPSGQTVAVLSMALRAIATISLDGGALNAVFAPGTSCWDAYGKAEQSESGFVWSPDGNSLAITMRTPPWETGMPSPTNQRASIAVIDLARGRQLALIDDAYDPTWTK